MDKIRLTIDANERRTSHAKELVRVAAEDIRFWPAGYASLPVDVRFSLDAIKPDIFSYFSGAPQGPRIKRGHENELELNVELKGPRDYVSSVIGGRLYSQILCMRERQQPGIVVVLGSDEDIRSVIEDDASNESKSEDERKRRAMLFNNLLMDFEANSYALGIPIFCWGDQPYRRLLAYAHKILTGGSLFSHLPKAVEEERQIAALCILVKGIGMKKAKAILGRCESLGNLSRICHSDDRALRAIPGIGPILAERIREALWPRDCDGERPAYQMPAGRPSIIGTQSL